MGGQFARRFSQASRWALVFFAMHGTAVHAAVKPHEFLTDNAVLQQGVPLPITGTTNSTDPVQVSIAGQQQSATPEGGKWQLTLAPLKTGAPLEMTISQGETKLTLKNILVGEVWLCGGQSNMQWTVQQSQGAKEAIASAGNDKIRLLTVDRNEKRVPSAWQLCGPETVAPFSAVGYYFGRELQKNLAVPVGLISSNVGGTTAERWMSPEALSAPEFRDMHAPQGKSDLYLRMIRPLAPCAVAGAIWYQGESNTDRAYHYRKLLPAMIADWRKTLGSEFPFLIVQLAPFQGLWPTKTQSDWAELRESQLLTARNVPQTAMVVITDLGDEKDVHPVKKAEVGTRLALAARGMAYGEKIEYSGPMFDSMEVDGARAKIHFTHVGGGLEADGPMLTGFAIAGDDRKFVDAEAEIVGDTVVVSSAQVKQPAAVRYGWQNVPHCNLRNSENLPASPFRTDDWPVRTQEIK